MKRYLLTTAAAVSLPLITLVSPALSQGVRPPVPEVKMCTGPEDGNYAFAGIEIKRQGQGVVNVRLPSSGTKGSMDNLELLAAGNCDVAIVQSDAYGVFVKTHQNATLDLERGRVLYPEYVHLICNKAAGLSRITGLKKGMVVLVGPNGGGASVTWNGFKLANPERYGEIASVPIGGKRGLGLVDEGKDATCLLYVAGLGSTTMMEADQFAATSGHLELVAADDSSLLSIKDPKGRVVYESGDIPSGTYPNAFQTRHLTGSAVGTTAVQAIVVANVAFIEANEKTYDKFLSAVASAMPAILEHVAGGRK